MSSILKALKKLEDEKSTLQDEKEINVSREILKRTPEQGISARWLWLFGSSAILIIIILTFALIRKPSQNTAVKSKDQQAAPTLLTVQEPLVLPPSKNSDKKQNVTLPLSAKIPNSGASRQTAVPASETFTIKEKSEQPKTFSQPIEPPKIEPVTKIPPLLPTVNSEASLTLSGIAWNRDSADRLAIINGQPVATGATISGAVIEEIMQDKVKLSHNGRTFELLIGRSARID